MPINYAHLRAFHAVAHHGSFTHAAAAVHLTQPTLSGQVKELEQRYGVQLLERHGRGVQATELGRSLHGLTQRLFALEQEIEQLLAAARGLRSGRLRVSADAPYHIVPLLAAFERRYPNIGLTLDFGNTATVRERLSARACDLAVLPNITADQRLHAIALRPTRLVVFVARGHAWSARRSIQLQELSEQRLILREPGSTTRAIFERASVDNGLSLTNTMTIGSREGVREAVAAGLGVGVVSETELGHDNRLHALTVRDATLENVETVVCLRERLSDPVVQAFFVMLTESPLVGADES